MPAGTGDIYTDRDRSGDFSARRVAAFGAFSAGGHFTMEQEFYEAIPGWIAGMAMMAARQANATH
jgi:2,3-dihydroxyphenylpropionate 1,2-dioxygenase